MTSFRSIAAAPTVLAALSLAATPAAAAEMPAVVLAKPVEAAPAWAPGEEASDYHRRYRYRRHRGVDAGDVLAGVLIIGGIAAIANAAKNSQDRRYRDRDYRYRDTRRGDYRQDYDARGIDRAVEMCADEIERNVRIESVDSVNRTARGWQVTGSLYNGEGFSCSIGQDGRIDAIDYGRAGAAWQSEAEVPEYSAEAPQDDRQYDEDYYASARARIDGQAPVDAQPSYPGGPLPGETAEDGELDYGDGYRGAGV